MNDPLAALRPLHAPPPIPWWPPAPGWWLLGVLLLGLLVLTLAALWRWRRRTAPRRAALAELRALPAGGELAGPVNRLLKRYALACFPRERVAGLSGRAWLAFLDEHGGEGRFRKGPGRVLANGPYGPDEPDEDPALLALARDWVRRNRPRAGA
jgi:hypothetical protein